MLVQVVQAKANDREGVKKMWERWDQEVKPASKGYLGATGGVTADGTLIVIARFESEADAEANNDVPEQQQWYSEFEKYLDGEPAFTNYTNSRLDREGGSDDAGFVQVIRIKGGDVSQFQAIEDEIGDKLNELRPDVIGGITVWEGGDITQVIYFTSEEEARKNESNPEFQELAKRFMDTGGEPSFYDISDPWLASA